jgi:polyribonucleotide nucleotidyltransferase
VEENKLNTQSVEFEYGNKTVKIETGKIARQATSSIIVTIDNLVVMTTMVARKEADPRKDFFPWLFFTKKNFMQQERSLVDTLKERLDQQNKKL